MTDYEYMRLALEDAEEAFKEGEVPVGAVLVLNDGSLVRAHNMRETGFDPTAHAEIIAIRGGALRLSNWRLTDAVLYVTKEPCVMCAGAMLNSRLGRLVYGCSDLKGGAVGSLYRLLSDGRLNHRVEVLSGILEDECAQLLKSFFSGLRSNSEDRGSCGTSAL